MKGIWSNEVVAMRVAGAPVNRDRESTPIMLKEVDLRYADIVQNDSIHAFMVELADRSLHIRHAAEFHLPSTIATFLSLTYQFVRPT